MHERTLQPRSEVFQRKETDPGGEKTEHRLDPRKEASATKSHGTIEPPSPQRGPRRGLRHRELRDQESDASHQREEAQREERVEQANHRSAFTI